MTEPETPQQQPLTEQEQAQLVAQIVKAVQGGFNEDDLSMVHAATDLKESCVEKGIPEDVVNRFIGKMLIRTNKDSYDSDIYSTLLELTATKIVGMYKEYTRVFPENVFIDFVSQLRFVVINPGTPYKKD